MSKSRNRLELAARRARQATADVAAVKAEQRDAESVPPTAPPAAGTGDDVVATATARTRRLRHRSGSIRRCRSSSGRTPSSSAGSGC